MVPVSRCSGFVSFEKMSWELDVAALLIPFSSPNTDVVVFGLWNLNVAVFWSCNAYDAALGGSMASFLFQKLTQSCREKYIKLSKLMQVYCIIYA